MVNKLSSKSSFVKHFGQFLAVFCSKCTVFKRFAGRFLKFRQKSPVYTAYLVNLDNFRLHQGPVELSFEPVEDTLNYKMHAHYGYTVMNPSDAIKGISGV